MSSSPVFAERLFPSLASTRSGVSGAALQTAVVLAGAAVVGVLAQLSIPVGPVPITGQTLGVLLVAASLGAWRGAASMASYAVLGLAGVPWFSNMTGGIAALAKPSFGFILGFIVWAWVVGRCAEAGWDRTPVKAFVMYLSSSAILFAFGLPYLWFALFFAGKTLTLGALLSVGLVPFLLGDVLKCAAAAGLSPLASSLMSKLGR